MKNLTEKRKQKAIDKWERFIEDVKKERKIDYDYKYLKVCDFCEAAIKNADDYNKKHYTEDECQDIACDHCNLFGDEDEDGLVVCYHDSCWSESYVSEAVEEADARNFKDALEYGKKVLSVIKKVRIDKAISKKRKG